MSGAIPRQSDPWFYVSEGETVGPATLEEIRAAIAQGVLTPETLVWQQGMVNWVSAQMTGLSEHFATGNSASSQARATAAVDQTRIREIEPKLAAFRDPASPLAKAIAAGQQSHPTPPTHASNQSPPIPSQSGMAGSTVPGSKFPFLLIAGISLFLLGLAALGLWYLDVDWRSVFGK